MESSLEKIINAKLEKCFKSLGMDTRFAVIKVSDRPDLSDFQCNGALALAKSQHKNPREIAEQIVNELQKDNPKKTEATEAMITFLVLNTGGVTLIPTTVIALRIMHGSANPTEIIITSILATAVSSISGLVLDYFIRRRKRL